MKRWPPPSEKERQPMTEPRTEHGRWLAPILEAEGIDPRHILAIENDMIEAEAASFDGLREALEACYQELEREHGHSSAWPDDTWPSCGLVHDALRSALAALRERETP